MTPLRLLGKGWTFPVGPNARTGRIDYQAGPDQVRQSIQIILETEPGERIMNPEFGCGLRRYLMMPNTPATRTQIRLDVERALSTFEPRIQLQEVATSTGDDPALVLIQIAYVHARDGRKDNLVYPFYLE